MNDELKSSELSQEDLAYVLLRCYKSLMSTYEYQKLISDELLYVAKLAKTTEELVRMEMKKQKINNNQKGKQKC